MVCINCSNQKTSVINSRTHKSTPQVWRRRRCLRCQCTFTTYERVSTNDEVQVTKLSGTKEAFNLGELVRDIISCFSHSPQKASAALWLAQTVENSLLGNKELVISSQKIALLTHQVVAHFDKLAGDQFAARHRRTLNLS